MNASNLGDSYDVVKRYLCEVARSLGYAMYVDPMFTGQWTSTQRASFYRFIGARPIPTKGAGTVAALLVDPDVGVRVKAGPGHVSFAAVASRCQEFELVLVFDQSFARGSNVQGDLVRKLQSLRELGVRGLYYDSHARFLICSKGPGPAMRFRKALSETGLPANRIVGLPKPGR